MYDTEFNLTDGTNYYDDAGHAINEPDYDYDYDPTYIHYDAQRMRHIRTTTASDGGSEGSSAHDGGNGGSEGPSVSDGGSEGRVWKQERWDYDYISGHVTALDAIRKQDRHVHKQERPLSGSRNVVSHEAFLSTHRKQERFVEGLEVESPLTTVPELPADAAMHCQAGSPGLGTNFHGPRSASRTEKLAMQVTYHFKMNAGVMVEILFVGKLLVDYMTMQLGTGQFLTYLLLSIFSTSPPTCSQACSGCQRRVVLRKVPSRPLALTDPLWRDLSGLNH